MKDLETYLTKEMPTENKTLLREIKDGLNKGRHWPAHESHDSVLLNCQFFPHWYTNSVQS